MTRRACPSATVAGTPAFAYTALPFQYRLGVPGESTLVELPLRRSAWTGTPVAEVSIAAAAGLGLCAALQRQQRRVARKEARALHELAGLTRWSPRTDAHRVPRISHRNMFAAAGFGARRALHFTDFESAFEPGNHANERPVTFQATAYWCNAPNGTAALSKSLGHLGDDRRTDLTRLPCRRPLRPVKCRSRALGSVQPACRACMAS